MSYAKCPWCGEDDEYTFEEGLARVLSWSGDGSFIGLCSHCGKKFRAEAPLEVYMHTFYCDEDDYDPSKINLLYDEFIFDQWDASINIEDYYLRDAYRKRKELDAWFLRKQKGSKFDASALGSEERIAIEAPRNSVAVAGTFDTSSLFAMPEPKKEFDISALVTEVPAKKNTFDVSSLIAPVRTKAFDASALFSFSKRNRTKGAR